MDLYYQVYGDKPEAGQTISASNIGGVLTAKDADLKVVPYTLWGDYIGSTVERSNARVLWDEYSSLLVRVRGDYGSEFLAIPVSFTPEADDDDLKDYLQDTLEKLDRYPLVSDDDHSELEAELIQEAIDDYLIADLLRDNPESNNEALRNIVMEYLFDGNESPYCEDAVGSVVFPKIEEYVKNALA